tara:strand:+ start:296 stop:643 length:348 start_codon:yes stop_codon:yes gene_type:complete
VTRIKGLTATKNHIRKLYQKGRAGGWSLLCELSEVTLLDVYQAVGEPTLFAIGSRNEHTNCLVEKAVNKALADSLDQAECLLSERFGAIVLQSLYEGFSQDMATLKDSLANPASE